MCIRDRREGVLSGGFQDGVRVMDVDNGGNLSATVLPGRCMDIYQVRYKGKNMNYLAPCGIVAPEYYDAQGTRWLRNFFVGMLTTCGLQHFGNPQTKNGEELGLHGRIANTPAENVKYARGLDVYKRQVYVRDSGTMKIFGEEQGDLDTKKAQELGVAIILSLIHISVCSVI